MVMKHRDHPRTALVGSLLFAGILLLLVGGAAAQSTVSSRALREAREALERGEAGRAVDVLEGVLRRDPGAIDAMELLARALDQAGRKDDARRTAERILQALPGQTSVRLWLAQLLEREGALADAGPHYARVVKEVDPESDTARLARLGQARVLIEQGSPAAAREVLGPLLGADADETAVLMEIRALRKERELDLAIEAARKHSGRLPAVAGQLASLLHESGMVALRAHDFETAGRRLRDSAALKPDLQVDLDLSVALEAQRKGEEALAVLRAAARRAGAPAAPTEVALAVADRLCVAGAAEEALEVARAILGREPASRAARLVEIRCLRRLDREAELRAHLEELVADRREDADWQTALLLAMRDLEHLPGHVEFLLERGFSAKPAAAATWIYLLRSAGRASLQGDDLARARRFLAEARRLAPGDPLIRRELGWVEFAAERHEESLRLWRSDLEGPDPPAELLAAGARCHHAAGRLDEALALSRRAVTADPSSSEIRRLHWRLLDEAGRTEELVEALSPDRLVELTRADGEAAANILARRRDDPAFQKCLDRWLVKRPESAELTRVAARASRDRARTARAWGESDRALRLARRTVELAPDRAWAYRDLASLLAESGDHEGALKAYREAVRLDPSHVGGRVRLINALRVAGRFREAADAVDAAPESAASDPGFLLAAVQLYLARKEPRLAEGLARRLTSRAEAAGDERSLRRGRSLLVSCRLKAKDSDAALATLEQMIRRHPEDTVALQRYLAACTWLGAERRCVSFLNRMQRAFPREIEIASALARYYMARKDRRRAAQAIERCISLAPDDPSHWNDLGRTELEQGNYDAARRAFDRAHSLVPSATWPRFGLAEVELDAGRYPQVIALCDEILAENPWLQPALWLKVRAYQRSGDFNAALRTWDSMYGFMVDEEEHYLVRARILHGDGRFSEARRELEQVLAHCRAGVLPILLYHGVSDDMQPATIHDERLRDHFRALREAGYVSIGLQDMEDWLAGKRALPERAVLITFDDARLDNLLYADGPLREFGFKAVEFVPTARVEARRTFHMSWDDLRGLLASGHWEVAAHGHRAHDRVGIDPAGTSSPFLAARRWLKGEQRLETREEYVARIDEDYHLCQQTLTRELGVEPSPFYSFSFNDFGQREISNAPWIFEVNERALTHCYRRGFHQSGGAYNIRTGDGMRYLARFSVPPEWSGAQLVDHLRRHHPVARTRLELGRLLSWTGEYNDALREIDLAEKAGAEETEALNARAHALLWRGNRVAANDAFRRLLDLDPGDARSLEIFERLERDRRPGAKVLFDSWWDKDDRSIIGQTVQGDMEAAKGLRLLAGFRHAVYLEKGLDDITAWAPRIGVEASLDGPTELEASIGQSYFSGADDQVDYGASVRWQGLDRLSLSGDVAGGAVQTVSAIAEGERLDAQSVLARYLLTIDDQLALSFRNAFYSDGNVRQTVRFRYSHRFLESPALRAGYVGVYDNAREDRREYYTPDNLQEHSAYVRLDADWEKKLELTAHVAGGWGVEGGDGRVIGQGYLRLAWRPADRAELFGEIGHQHSPDYYASYFNAGLDLRF